MASLSHRMGEGRGEGCALHASFSPAAAKTRVGPLVNEPQIAVDTTSERPKLPNMNVDQQELFPAREASEKQFAIRISPAPVSDEAVKSKPSLAMAALLFIALAGAAFGQDAPAVSEVNGKMSYAGGNMNSAEGHNFDGSVTLPLTRQFGFQADGLYSRISDLDFGGGAGHLFWRDPKIGLLGVTGGYLGRAGVQTYQAGAEGEYYLGRFTFGFFGGAGSIHYDQAVPFIDTNPTRFIGRLSAGYYPVDNLLLRVSYLTAFKENLVKAELEYQTPLCGLALTGEVARGDHGYDHWLLGVRYYFGAKKSLMDRHRQDDPPGFMQQVLHGLGLYGAEYNRNGNDYWLAHRGTAGTTGPPPPGNPYGDVYGWYATSDAGGAPPSPGLHINSF